MHDSYKKYLQHELALRVDRNPRYSLRAFAKSLDVDAAALSRILSDKMVPSLKMAHKIIQKLSLPPDSQAEFLSSLAEKHRARGLKRIHPYFRGKTTDRSLRFLDLDMFRIISDWYHIAILELTQVKGFSTNPQWISTQLNITETEALLALNRLKETGLLKEKNGGLVKSADNLSTAHKSVSTSALRKRFNQILDKSSVSLEKVPVEARNHTGMTMAIDPAKIPEAKKMISSFNKRLCKFLESGTRKKVYELSISLFPLQNLDTPKELS